MLAPKTYKAVIIQVHSRKAISITVDDLEDDILSLYLLMRLGKESDK